MLRKVGEKGERGTQFVDPAPASTSEREDSIGTSDILHHDALFTCHQREQERRAEERKGEGTEKEKVEASAAGKARRGAQLSSVSSESENTWMKMKMRTRGKGQERGEAEEEAWSANRCVACCRIRKEAEVRRRCLHPQLATSWGYSHFT